MDPLEDFSDLWREDDKPDVREAILDTADYLIKYGVPADKVKQHLSYLVSEVRNNYGD